MVLLGKIKDEAGMSLTELLVACSLLLIVLSATYFALETVTTSFAFTSQTNRTYEIARQANNELTDKIKRAELPLIEASSDSISFMIDLLPETGTPVPEQLTYTYVADDGQGNDLNIVEKSVFSNTGSLISRDIVATNVINRLVFNFYDANRQEISIPQDVTSPEYRTLIRKVHLVRITSRIQVEDIKGRPKNVNLESEVSLRNAP